MKKKYPQMKISGWFYLLALMAGTSGNLVRAQDMDGEGPVNPDLDTAGVRLVIRVQGAYEIPDGTFWASIDDVVYLKHRLSRNPQPRNEWIFEKYGVEKYVDDTGWIRWNTLYVDTSTMGVYELIFRAEMEFYKLFEGEKRVYTPSSQLFLHVIDGDPIPPNPND